MLEGVHGIEHLQMLLLRTMHSQRSSVKDHFGKASMVML